MKQIIVFDSDFIIANMPTMSDYIERLNEYECFVSIISINEVAKHYSLGNISKIKTFKNNLRNYNKYGIVFQKDDKEIKEIVEKDVESTVKSIFKDNIIMNHSRTSSQILSRAYDKIPPFGKSDCGFKDTLILLDIMDYIKGKKIEKMFLVSKDGDFLDQKNDIQKEVLEKTSCKIEIVDGNNPEKLLNYFKVDKNDETTTLSKKADNSIDVDINEIRKELDDICYHLFHFDGFDPYGGDYVGNNFEADTVVSKKEIEKFLDALPKNINNNIFNTNVLMSDFFNNPFLFENEHKIDVEYFEKLNSIYLKVKNNESYKNALLNLLYSNFYSLANYKIKSAEDLPF